MDENVPAIHGVLNYPYPCEPEMTRPEELSSASATAVPSRTPTPPSSLAGDDIDSSLGTPTVYKALNYPSSDQQEMVPTEEVPVGASKGAQTSEGSSEGATERLEEPFQGLSPPPQRITPGSPNGSGTASGGLCSASSLQAQCFESHTMDGGWSSEEKRGDSFTDGNTEIDRTDITLEQTRTSMHRMKDLIQTAIKQVKEAAILRPTALLEQFYKPNLEDKITSALEEALAKLSGIETGLEAQGAWHALSNESWGEGTSATSIAESTEPDQPPCETTPLDPPFSASYTIDGPLQQNLGKSVEQFAEELAQRFAEALGIYISRQLASGPEQPCDFERLIQALEKRFIPASPTTPPSNNTPKSGENKAGHQASKLEYKHVIEAWDAKAGKYKTVQSESKPDELDVYLFVVRMRIDKITQKKTTYIDIKSTEIRDVLREACRDVCGISLDDSLPSIEQNAVFHIRKDLKRRQQCIEGQPQDGVLAQHLAVFTDYLDSAFQSTEECLSSLLAKSEITYDMLWALFEPDAEVYTTCRGTNASRCVLFNHMEEISDISGTFMHIEARYLGSDGKFLGEVTTTTKIPVFRGTKRIELLPAYPLQYHLKQDEIRTELMECGRKFVGLLGVHHKDYKGRAFDIDEKGQIVVHEVEGRIMVDSICFQQSKPNYPYHCVRRSRARYDILGERGGTVQLGDMDPAALKPKDLLTCSPTVLGFSFDKKMFLEFAVANISDIEWSSCSFEDVQLPPTPKKLILALTETYLEGESLAFQDLVQGKGRGRNFLLYGTPGTGKTLTAETLANTFKVAFYTVAAGQIGVDAVQVEKFLKNIFKVASRWKAILLLDEADVFLAERTDNHLHQNALVSVFLRELEQYEGILFLTTNRMQTFDPAIISRIHLALKYEPLKRDARKAVWQLFLGQATTVAGPADCPDKVLDKLVDKELNGREIRNIVFTALSLAAYEKTVVNESHLTQSVETRELLRRDFHGAGATENTHSYL